MTINHNNNNMTVIDASTPMAVAEQSDGTGRYICTALEVCEV